MNLSVILLCYSEHIIICSVDYFNTLGNSLTSSEIYLYFLILRGSQNPIIRLCHESHESSLAMFLYQIHFNIVFALCLDHTGGLCCSLFQLKICMPFRTCTALLMLLDLIPQRYLVNGINYETLHNAVLSSLLVSSFS